MTPLSATFLIGGLTTSPGVGVLVLSLVIVVIAAALLYKTITYCLDDLNHRASVADSDRRFWTLVIILGGPVGQLLYLLYGRGPY